MIFHASLPADEPERVARVLAELWAGEDLPFPPWPGARVVFAGDDRNSTIEVYPRSQPMVPGEKMVEPRRTETPAKETGWHLAVATSLSAEAVVALAEREGWRTLLCNRGGMFDVVELWLENVTLLEVLTPEMQSSYLATNTAAQWRRIFNLPIAA